MNERIKALAVDADFMLCEDGDFYSEGQSQKITDGLQKFAELIVQECIEVVGDCSDQFATRSQITEEIKQHFGVE